MRSRYYRVLRPKLRGILLHLPDKSSSRSGVRLSGFVHLYRMRTAAVPASPLGSRRRACPAAAAASAPNSSARVLPIDMTTQYGSARWLLCQVAATCPRGTDAPPTTSLLGVRVIRLGGLRRGWWCRGRPAGGGQVGAGFLAVEDAPCVLPKKTPRLADFQASDFSASERCQDLTPVAAPLDPWVREPTMGRREGRSRPQEGFPQGGSHDR